MYIQRIDTKQNGKTYTSVVLCHSYREKGKQKRKILATITKWPEYLIKGLEKLLKEGTVTSIDDLEHKQGKSFGAVWFFYQLARHIGLDKALGTGIQGKLALLQILARCIDPSSRLHIANYWMEHYAIEEVLKIKQPITENDLYKNLDWLGANQEKIENRLFSYKYGDDSPIVDLYLYDVTSSYFEGQQNGLAEYGYNRDKKKGKKQIVIGLLCDYKGDPISVEVFRGNTSDLSTFKSQIIKLKEQFGIKRVTIVGDKGMLKSRQIDDVNQMEWNYITSITKGQVKKLISDQVIQMELFDDEPIEIAYEGVRYILRRNNTRAEQIQENRVEKMALIASLVEDQNKYLAEHSRAKVATANRKIQTRINKLKLKNILKITEQQRSIHLEIDQEDLAEARLLDGCYVIKTELKTSQLSTLDVHDRYKDLSKAEHAFRTIKTGIEQIRPIFVRKESRTRGHVLVCMLAYKLIHRFRSSIENLNEFPTIAEMIKSLEAIHYSTYTFNGKQIKILPSKLNNTQQKILSTLNLKMPTKLYAK